MIRFELKPPADFVLKLFKRIYEDMVNEKLTPDVLNDMVQAVYAHAPDTSGGQRIQDVDISYNYIGMLSANLLYGIISGKAA